MNYIEHVCMCYQTNDCCILINRSNKFISFMNNNKNIQYFKETMKAKFERESSLLGHMGGSHGLYCISSSGHGVPPLLGGGWLHSRVLVRVPFSHVTEQSPQPLHKLHPPRTWKHTIRVRNKYSPFRHCNVSKAENDYLLTYLGTHTNGGFLTVRRCAS